MSTSEALVRMRIKSLMLDPNSNIPIVVLHDEAGNEMLPIWIGVFEANAIALKLEGVEPPRPMTHDLVISLLEHVGAHIERIVICDLRESTFYAQIILHLENEEVLEIDARPSDAIALAIRVGAPVFVAQAVLNKVRSSDLSEDATSEERLKKWLEEIDPDDLGKYTM